jgi:hypothetical protein
MPTEDVVRSTPATLGRGVPPPGSAESEPDRRGTSDERSRAHDDFHTAKFSVSQVVGYIKGKSAIHLARVYGERKRNFVGQHFWARGYFVSTVGRDEKVIREYIRSQEQEDERLDQLKLNY